jgi:NAD(P)-dependent dehydrogenase (short-subunit alcohol dehydrogenase family)
MSSVVGGGGFIVQADASLSDDLGQLFQRVERAFGMLDVFVANAWPELATFYATPHPEGAARNRWRLFPCAVLDCSS